MKKVLFFVTTVALIYLAYLGFKASYSFSVKEGAPAPNFSATLTDSTKFQLSDLKGNYVLLDFWASWCGPCRLANSKLVELQKKHPEKLTIVTVALEKNNKDWKKAAIEDSFTWKHQIVEQEKAVIFSKIARKYGVTEIPTKFLIYPDGNLKKELSFSEIDKILSQ